MTLKIIDIAEITGRHGERSVSLVTVDPEPTWGFAGDSMPSLHLDDDLPLGSTLLEIRKRLLRLFERKYLVDHRPDAPRL